VNLLLLLAVEGEEKGDPPNPVIPEINEIIWAAVFFFILWALMKFVLLPPILKAMENRTATLQSDRDAADAAAASLGAARRDHEASINDARAEANQILSDARAKADERRAELQAEADAEIAELRRQAQADIDQARSEALTSMRGDVSELAVSAASAVLGRPIDGSNQQDTIDRALGSD